MRVLGYNEKEQNLITSKREKKAELENEILNSRKRSYKDASTRTAEPDGPQLPNVTQKGKWRSERQKW